MTNMNEHYFKFYSFCLAPEGTFKRGIRDAFIALMKDEGPKALYKGCIPVMLRAFPANAACFLGFEFAMKLLNLVAPSL